MKFWISLILPILGVLVFQNCSEVRVQPASRQVLASVNVEVPNANVCAPESVAFGAPMKVIFLVDMSMSNVGSLGVYSSEEKNCGSKTYGSSGNTYTIFNTLFEIDKTDGPTDLQGSRFTQVRKFIETCGGSSNISYSTIGFGEGNLFSRNNSCLSPFLNQTDALYSVDGLKSLQDHDVNLASGCITNPFYLQSATSYKSGLQCVKDKVSQDLAMLESTNKPIYNVFMLTDGSPTDRSSASALSEGFSDPQNLVNYKAILNSIKNDISLTATGLNFFPVFYTSTGAKNQGAEQIMALDGLDKLAKEVNPKNSVINLTDLASGQSELCAKMKPDATIHYDLKKMYAINVTAVRKDSILYPDSDADGVSDQEETELGWDPLNPRSTGILDSLCITLGKDSSKCKTELAKLTCTSDPTGIGLTDCDLKMAATIFGSTLSGVDTDKDLLPDFIEILRGSNPGRNDAFDNPMVDGTTNFDKITLGLDLSSSLSLHPVNPSQNLQINYVEEVANCNSGQKQFHFTLDQVPLVNVKEYIDSSTGPINFSHNADENVIIVFSYWQGLGGLTKSDRLYGQKVLIPINGKPTIVGNPVFLGEL